MTISSSIINIKTDPSVKKEAQIIAKKLGISLSGILNAYLRQLIHKQEIHFSCKEFLPNKQTTTLLTEINQDIEKNINISKEYDKNNISEAFKR
jgi:addiction module RelB/DinJ family antitoxin